MIFCLILCLIFRVILSSCGMDKRLLFSKMILVVVFVILVVLFIVIVMFVFVSIGVLFILLFIIRIFLFCCWSFCIFLNFCLGDKLLRVVWIGRVLIILFMFFWVLLFNIINWYWFSIFNVVCVLLCNLLLIKNVVISVLLDINSMLVMNGKLVGSDML